MIIRHDLELVFLHIPKCAGKKLRWIFKNCGKHREVEEYWNYSHSSILNRYVDMAHLPMSDIRHYEAFKSIKKYKVIACIRNPYMRLSSSANEYYRQKSKKKEQIIKNGGITENMKQNYYAQLEVKHNELDPRYIHSLPMHRFTHYGKRPMTDHLLRCENLKEEFMHLAVNLQWPEEIMQAGNQMISGTSPDLELAKPTEHEITIANDIYLEDFKIFDYPQQHNERQSEVQKSNKSGKILNIHKANAVRWHWGPKAKKDQSQIKAVR